VTSRIGLVSTATKFNVPYQLARQFQTLDQLTGGRLGWNAVTSFGGERQFGLDELPDQDVRYRRGAEFVEIVQGLWRGWQPGAVTADGAGKPQLDAAKIDEISFSGEFLRAEGALGVPRSPQGWPVQFQPARRMSVYGSRRAMPKPSSRRPPTSIMRGRSTRGWLRQSSRRAAAAPRSHWCSQVFT
jgi:alkanesulfonate monooxygenase SsuD/methylene tetrahydromethanopterin reductase-like flavin-dependent oxidoreductase (luciferase family)